MEWLLRQWKKEDWLKQVNEKWANDTKAQAKHIKAIQQWYVNSQGQTMVVIPGPVQFTMGSPPDEDGRYDWEAPHLVRVGRTFAIAAKPVTCKQYLVFDPTFAVPQRFAPSKDCPIVNLSWYQAARYCNWLSKSEKPSSVTRNLRAIM